MVDDPYLKFTNEYLAWKQDKEMTYHKWLPEEFLEEVILKEKAEAFDKIWDLFVDGNPGIEEVKAIVDMTNGTV